MTVGKNPHRPEGKTHADDEHMQGMRMSAMTPPRQNVTRAMEPRNDNPEDVQIGGSRPGVPSRVKQALGMESPPDDADA